ncbi:MAG: hypothetical protein II817_00535 [Bacteroidales bacterium]|nr:hypothetical protein [Bacteroidales bacterium]
MSEEKEKRQVTQAFNIKLYPDEIERFNTIKGEMDNVTTSRATLIALMDFFENPRTVTRDNPALVEKVRELEANAKTQTDTIADLQRQLEEAKSASNTNAEAGTALQLRIDDLEKENERLRAGEKHSPYYIGGELPPVPYFYASKMARLQSQKDKQVRTPFYILANNFIQDLQNPLANHLPMIVSSDELRKAQADYEKSLKKTEPKKEE